MYDVVVCARCGVCVVLLMCVSMYDVSCVSVYDVLCVSCMLWCGVVCDHMMWRLSTSDQQTFQTINWGNNVVTSSSSHSPWPGCDGVQLTPGPCCNMKHNTVLVTGHLLPNPAQL